MMYNWLLLKQSTFEWACISMRSYHIFEWTLTIYLTEPLSHLWVSPNNVFDWIIAIYLIEPLPHISVNPYHIFQWTPTTLNELLPHICVSPYQKFEKALNYHIFKWALTICFSDPLPLIWVNPCHTVKWTLTTFLCYLLPNISVHCYQIY